MAIRAATATTSLGRYQVVKRLAAGGMADVLLARTDGIEGFERHVVIKRIHAELLSEPRYVKMFVDEARLAASLHHHNIVQVNDIGHDAGEYFFAMEYVHGEDARTLLIEASKRGEKIPLEHVITIVTAAASGLHHAHEQRGPDRNPLHIVHRDVSPANILIGYDGGVKVADFGIAQAAHRAEQTQSGVLKGKVAYMSPEQCNCEPIDRRSDVFSLGIVLYELLAVRPCFHGETDFMTMNAIVNGVIEKPSNHNAAISPALEAIVMKALARKPDDRYTSADEMRVALDQFATTTGLRTSSTALADYMKAQFGTRPEPWLEGPEWSELDEGRTEDEPMVEIRLDDVEDHVITRPRTLDLDDDLAIAQAPAHGIDLHARSVKETLQLRAMTPPPRLEAVPQAIDSAAPESRTAAIRAALAQSRERTKSPLRVVRAPVVGPPPTPVKASKPAEADDLTLDRDLAVPLEPRASVKVTVIGEPKPTVEPTPAAAPVAASTATTTLARPALAARLTPGSAARTTWNRLRAITAKPFATPETSGTSATSAAAEPVAVVASPTAARTRTLWFAGSIAAVIIAAIALFVVVHDSGSSRPAKAKTPSVAPTRAHVERLPSPSVAPAPAATTINPVEGRPVATPKGSHKSRGKAPATTPEKWDPDALFPAP